MRPPHAVLEVARGAARVVEVGAGEDFSTALALAGALPGTQVVVTDVREGVLRAPAPLVSRVDDVTRPDWSLYQGARLVYAVRAPEELQVPLARVARRVGAALALRALKDEWADLEGEDGPPRVLGGGWRLFVRPP